MEVISSVLNWLSSNICRIPHFRRFIGVDRIRTLKKPAHDVFSGFVKATVGYMLLNVGAGGFGYNLPSDLSPLTTNSKLVQRFIDPCFGLAAANNKIAAEFPDFVGTATASSIDWFRNKYLAP